MPLINCPDCNRQISSDVKACIHCGKPLPQALSNTKVGLPAFFIILGLIIFAIGATGISRDHEGIRFIGGIILAIGIVFLVARLIAAKSAG